MSKHLLIKAMAIAGFSAGILVSTAANALYQVDDMPAIQSGFPSDMADWMANPTKYSWNPENVRRGKHSDRPDDVIYIFLNKTDADAWWDGLGGTPPAGIPDTAVAYMHWALDNGTGTFPGVMAISDDKNFKTNSCIMASGNIIPTEDGTSEQDKTCSNYEGSSKRFKLVILKADQPIDLIFNTTDTTFSTTDPIKTEGDPTHLVYDFYSDPAASPDVDVTDNIFRNYRHIMKVGNGTATDTAGEVRDGTRLAGIKVELGFTDIGGTGAFAPTDINGADGLTYELEVCIADRYFDVDSGQSSAGTNDCGTGETEVWLEDEFATFSPSMYAMVGDKRNPEGGYWDKNPAGIYPPPAHLQTANSIDSGTEIDATTGKVGAVTDNYFDVAANQAAGAGTPLPENMFGYMVQYGNFHDGDPGLIPPGIYKDDDGDPATEGELYAWWDGSSPTCCYRWGIDGDPNGVDDSDAWEIVSDADLAEIASRPLDENIPSDDPPRYEVAFMDDLGGLNVDTFIKIADTYSVATNPTFTVRFTGQSIVDAGVDATAPGVADGDWVANPAMDIFHPTISGTPATTVFAGTAYSFTPVGGSLVTDDTLVYSIANKPTWASFDTTTGALTGTPAATDVGTTADIVISVENTAGLTSSLPAFTLTVNELIISISGTPATTVLVDIAYSFTPVGESNDPNDTLVYSIANKPLWASFDTTTGALTGTPATTDVGATADIVITVTNAGDFSDSLPAFTLTVTAPSSSSGCSCTYNPDGSVDPLLPALVFASLIFLGLRSKKSDV